jgi:hypothetical protein
MRILMTRRSIGMLSAAGVVSLVAGLVAGSRAEAGGNAAHRVTDTAAGITFAQPGGWHLTMPPISSLSVPRERLLLTSYRADRGGNCGPDRAERELPADGALVYLMEYRPSAKRSAFPPRPAHFRLRRADLGNYECWRVPSYLIRFRDAGRLFQLHVALGPHATAAHRAQVLRILDSLRFEPLRGRVSTMTAEQIRHAST